jgi:phage tail sheath protein FI
MADRRLHPQLRVPKREVSQHQEPVMSAPVASPGTFVDALPGGIRTITGVATAICAFVGYTARGVDQRPTMVLSFSDFERQFGGYASDSELSYAVGQFFDNGGRQACVVRIPKSDALAATVHLYGSTTTPGAHDFALSLTAIGKGAWANRLVVDVDYVGVTDDRLSYNLSVTDRSMGATESFHNLSGDPESARYCAKVLNDLVQGSRLVVAVGPLAPGNRPAETGLVGLNMPLLGTGVATSDGQLQISVLVGGPATRNWSIPVDVYRKDDVLPATAEGWARLLEGMIAAAFKTRNDVPAGVNVCVVPNSSGDGMRVFADLDPQVVAQGAFDALVQLSAGPPATDALAPLGFDAAAPPNVGHYLLGSTVSAGAQNAEPDGVTRPQARGADGSTLPLTADLIGDSESSTGIHALDRVELFTLLCIPDATRASTENPDVLDGGGNLDPTAIYQQALALFASTGRRAFLLVDPPPDVNDAQRASDWMSGGLRISDPNAAAYFPRLRLPDPCDGATLRTFAPSGVIAGLFSRIDANPGIWRAAAGPEATLHGVQGMTCTLSDTENRGLNQLGLNCLRTFPIQGPVCWGSRTLAGSDAAGSEWKYVPVRRLALFIEESIFRGTRWVFFEPNDETLWAQLRLSVGEFMHDLFRKGALQGGTPQQAYVVRCDSLTTTRFDIDHGVVNIVVEFALLKPAEFNVIRIRQLAGQLRG